ncbi:MAG TPA: ATP-binding cassette domain-containing protein [Pirellulaceae bacterium]|jgi:molybdate transport system ATP-binding protein|nr:ATP-binding cassette domain-containing protein [Pirellulaceae bacterium]
MNDLPLLEFACRHRYADGFELDARFATDASVTALFGTSGSGKTTILSLIAGLLRPTAGMIRFRDQAFVDTARNRFLPPERRRVGVLFQERRLFPHLTVRSNIAYGARRRQGGTPIDATIEALEIGDLLDRYPRTLSGGQQQRVALARAVASAPEILLLDEPLTGVEAPLRDRIADYLQQVIAQIAVPTLLVTHHRELVDRLAQRSVAIEAGRVVAEN